MKIIIFVLMIMLTIVFAHAEPVLVEQGAYNPTENCRTFEELEVRFTAADARNYVGLKCSDDVRVALYECAQGDCSSKQLILEGFKTPGQQIIVDNMDIGTTYAYECLACKQGTTSQTVLPGEPQVCPECETCENVEVIQQCPEQQEQTPVVPFFVLALILGALVGFYVGKKQN